MFLNNTWSTYISSSATSSHDYSVADEWWMMRSIVILWEQHGTFFIANWRGLPTLKMWNLLIYISILVNNDCTTSVLPILFDVTLAKTLNTYLTCSAASDILLRYLLVIFVLSIKLSETFNKIILSLMQFLRSEMKNIVFMKNKSVHQMRLVGLEPATAEAKSTGKLHLDY